MELKQLSIKYIEQIEELFASVFTKEPWKDDWSDKNQLHQYIKELIGNNNSLFFGLYDDKELCGISLGSVKHWYAGTEYCIEELCIKTEKQGKGLGSMFIELIQTELSAQGINTIFLQTERDMPAYNFYKSLGFFELEKHVSFAKNF